MAGAPNRGLFHPDHPRRIIPELSANYHRNGWFVGTGCGGFISIKQGDSVYVGPSNVVKNRIEADDLFAYKVSDSSVSLSPSQDRKLSPCEIVGSILLVFKERKSAGAVLHSNGREPCLASLVYAQSEFRIKNQAAIKGIYNDGLKRYYNMDEELIVPIINHSTEAELKRVLKKYPHTNAVVIRNQGMFVWGETWQKCQSMAEAYHFLMDLAVQMEKLGLNVYTHDTTSSDVVAMNNSISAAAAAATEEPPVPSLSPAKKGSPSSRPKASPAPAAAAAATTTTAPSSSPKPPAAADAKKAEPKTAAGKASPLNKTAGGKVSKGRAAARGRGGPANRGRGNPRRGSSGRNGPGFGPGPMMGPMGMMMGPGHMGPPPIGPPMGGPPMGPPMGPPVGMMRPPMMRAGPSRGGRRRGAEGKRGRRGTKDGSVSKKQNGKAGMAKDVLMNY